MSNALKFTPFKGRIIVQGIIIIIVFFMYTPYLLCV